MPQMKRIDGDKSLFNTRSLKEEKVTQEEYEDHLDYYAAAEAIDEALETGEIRSFEDFAKEIGI